MKRRIIGIATAFIMIFSQSAPLAQASESGAEKVVIGEVQYYEEYGLNFAAESGIIIGADPEKVTGDYKIPDKIGGAAVTAIYENAFSSLDSLTSITIPKSVKSIGDLAFEDCSSLTKAVISNGVESIGNYAFVDCQSLESITLPDSVTSIGEGAFMRCESLADVKLSKNLKSMGEQAFLYCTNLKSVTIPEGMESISFRAFGGCGLTSVAIPGSVKNIQSSAFDYCENLTEVTLSEGVETIGRYAFSQCNLQNVKIPASVTNIESEAFGMNSNLKSITVAANSVSYSDIDGVLFSKDKKRLMQYPAGKTDTEYQIPNQTSSIDRGAFYGDGPERILIPASVTNIAEGAFSTCYNLTGIDVASGSNYYKSENGILFSKNGKQLLQYPRKKEDSEYTVPDGVERVCSQAFFACRNLNKITLPGSVTSIGSEAFTGCRGITELTIPDGVKTIEYNAFSICDNLTKLTIPNSVTEIGRNIILNSDNAVIYCHIDSYAYNYDYAEYFSIIPYDNIYIKSQYYGYANGKYTVSATLGNDSSSEKSGVIVMAAYNKNGKLLDAKFKEVTVIPDRGSFISQTAKLDFDCNFDIIKIFVWDSLSSMTPCASAHIINLQDE